MFSDRSRFPLVCLGVSAWARHHYWTLPPARIGEHAVLEMAGNYFCDG
jgi:hypothetical protein